MPKVSVIIPTYNRANLIVETLESVLVQTFQDFEILVIDDGSTDNTKEVLSNYLHRISYIKQDNAGPSVARNRGIFYARGQYIAFLDSDDLWYPSKLEKQISILESHPNISFVYCNCARGLMLEDNPVGFFDAANPISGRVFDRLVNDNLIWTPSVLIRKNVFVTSGVFDATLRGAEDYDLWLRIAYFFEGFYIDEVLCHVRDHAGRSVRSIDFSSDQCRAYEIQYARWSFVAGFQSKFKYRVAATYSNLANVARKAGDYNNAYSAMKKRQFYSNTTVRNRIKMLLFLFCPELVCWYDSKKHFFYKQSY